MTPITLEYLEQKGFKKVNQNTYRLEIKLPYKGERFIEAALMPKRWIAYYQVNFVAACNTKYYCEEVDSLISSIL